MKKRVSLVAAILLGVLTLTTVLGSCASSTAPSLEEVKTPFTELIEASYEINEIFFGEGLPTHDRDDAESEIIYYGFFGYDSYEIVRADCPYQNASHIKDVAARVYSSAYLDDIFLMAFDGYADDNSDRITTARYQHAGEYFLKYVEGDSDPFNILPGKRRYLYDTMEIGELSSADAVNLKIDSYLEGEEQKVIRVTLRFIKENGEWRLDTPTY